MRKTVFIIILCICAVFINAQDIQTGFIGEWAVVPRLIEIDDGSIIAPGSPYAFPYLGITRISFVDSGFVVFQSGGDEYRAFYVIDVLDYDNYHVRCTFKNGEEFVLKLTRGDGSWNYLYRIAEDSVLRGEIETDSDSEDEIIPEEQGIKTDETDETAESEEAEKVYSLYTGIIVRK